MSLQLEGQNFEGVDDETLGRQLLSSLESTTRVGEILAARPWLVNVRNGVSSCRCGCCAALWRTGWMALLVVVEMRTWCRTVGFEKAAAAAEAGGQTDRGIETCIDVVAVTEWIQGLDLGSSIWSSGHGDTAAATRSRCRCSE